MNKQIVVSRKSVTKGQASLYDLISQKIKDGKPITLNDAIKIYSSDVCRNYSNGKPAGYVAKYNSDTQSYTYIIQELDEYSLKVRSIQWLMQAIGSLVMKGFLKVTPMINLE